MKDAGYPFQRFEKRFKPSLKCPYCLIVTGHTGKIPAYCSFNDLSLIPFVGNHKDRQFMVNPAAPAAKETAQQISMPDAVHAGGRPLALPFKRKFGASVRGTVHFVTPKQK